VKPAFKHQRKLYPQYYWEYRERTEARYELNISYLAYPYWLDISYWPIPPCLNILYWNFPPD
jgi:hypothetical protein